LETIEIENTDLRAVFQPEWGGLLSALTFNHPAKGWVDAFVTEDQEPAAFKKIPFFGCFHMVPFANRLIDGTLNGSDADYAFPIVFEEENLAIHGTGWDKPWQVTEHTATSLTQMHSWSSPDQRYRFQVQFSARLQGASIELDLTLENLSDHVLPMGLGFHPWFSDIKRSKIRFDERLRVNRESPWNVYPKPDFDRLPAAFVPIEFDGLDAGFDDWTKKVHIDLYAKGLSVEMTSSGALDRIHVFVMGQNDRFCVEPVSHKPGDLLDPGFLVGPGNCVSGQMNLSCSMI